MDHVKALLWSVRALMLASFMGGAGLAEAQPLDREEQVWRQALGQGTVEGFQRYLEEFPVGRHAGDAFRYIVEGSIGGFGEAHGLLDAGPLTRGIVADIY